MSTPHLTSEQLFERLSGAGGRDELEHLRECGQCRAECERLERALGNFRQSANTWAVNPPRERAWFGLQQPALATAAMVVLMLLCFVLVVPARRHHRSTAADDEALLRQVDAEVVRTLPRPMEPLSRLIPSDLERQ